MRPVPARFLAAVAAGHTATVKATVLTPGGPVELETVKRDEGSVVLDARAASRGSFDLTVIDDGSLDLVPKEPGALLTPFGNELKIARGIRYIDGSEDLVGLGVFRIEDAETSDSGPDLSIRLSGRDRSAKVIDEAFEDTYVVDAGVKFTDAIRDGLLEVDPSYTFEFADSDLVTPIPLVSEAGGDRWAFFQNMAMAIAMDLYFDGDGVAVLRPLFGGSSVFSIAEGPGGVLLGATAPWSRDGVVNRWVISGQSSATTPIEATATDDDPASPTYYYGPFGKVPRFESLEYVSTAAQASDVAEALLLRSKSLSRPISFDSIVNPALEPDDVVTITRERMGLDSDAVLDTLSIPLSSSDLMSGTTRVLGGSP